MSETQQNEVIINAIIYQAVSTAIQELKRSNMVREGKNPYQKVEYLLYNYDTFKKGIENKNGKIQDVMDHGLGQKSKSITSYGGGGSTKDAEEKKMEYIEDVQRSIFTTQRCIDLINEALLQITSDKYYKIIPFWYFDGQSREDIAEYFEVDVKTITRNKNRLINKLMIDLFSDEVVKEYFN